ncbi:mucin-2 protein [Nocardioides silvaticus]|uniref:Mucin-2 protein n=1 Tax=Nocardioides silvaticus TaxID=2201891 RepID=A0A316TEM5_9ACTN|nr:mucin-2 protein [Nocardioides silvaticus]PWN01655.1 mucin-2 protein [Nocardioides silvaticus]
MATHRHKRETARRTPRAALIAAPLAVLATGAAVSAGVAGSAPAPDLLSADLSVAAAGTGDRDRDRPLGVVSRESGASRGESAEKAPAMVLSPVEKLLTPKAVSTAVKQADKRLWTTTTLNLWTRPDAKAKKIGEIESAEKVLVTGRTMKGREEIVLDGEARWVTAGYLSAEKPFALGGECTNGTSVPAAVSPNIKKVHEAVCAAFPEITVYGTFRSDGEHSQGIAVDIMVSGDRGWQVAEFVREHYADLGVSYLIYSQQIWSVERSSEGWRGMEDRGSATANHYDHVHVTTY